MKKLLSLFLVVAATALTACTGNSGGPKIKGDALLYDRENYLSTYRGLRLLGERYAGENFTFEVTNKGRYPVISNVKTLIVGVDFTDFPASGLPKGEEGTLKDLEKAILGKSEDTGWESLKSYYEKSSFGTCKIEGTVAPEWYHTNKSVTQFANAGTKNSQVKVLCKSVEDWARETFNLDMREYDANNDGFIDSVIMIYSCEPHVRVDGREVDDDLYWAFCWSRDVSAASADRLNPTSYRFFWASYRTFFEDGYYDDNGKHKDWTDAEIASGKAKLDAHTLIHEFGHVLSLPDYYNGNYTSSDPAAYNAISVDMMAYNIGDHNAWSKALYGWISPIISYGESEITIRSTTDTGDFIIIPTETMYDPKTDFTLLSQFIMLELVTPTGVAKADSEDAYAGSYPTWFSQAGIRATLVDARLGMFSYRSDTAKDAFQGFTGTVSGGDNYYVKFAYDNNDINRSANKNCKLVEIIPAREKLSNGSIIESVPAKNLSGREKNEALYYEGDEFNTTSSKSLWKNFKIDDNYGGRTTPFDYGFIVKSLSNKSATIEIINKTIDHSK